MTKLKITSHSNFSHNTAQQLTSFGYIQSRTWANMDVQI